MDMETGTPEPPGTPLLLRLERLEHQVAAWEEGQALPLISPSSNVTGETRWSEPSTPGSLERRCRPARSALEEVEEKGTVLERVSVLEQRVSLVSRTLFSGRELLLSSPSPAHVDGEAGSPGAAREDATLASNPAGEPVPTPQELSKLPQQEHAPPAPERPEKGQQKEPEDLTVASNPGVRPKEQENSELEKKEEELEKKEHEQEKKEQEREKKEQEQEKKEKDKREQEKREEKEQEQEKKEKDNREQEKREEEKRKQETEKKEQEKRFQEMKSAVEERNLAKARPWSKRLRKYLGGGCVSHDSFLNRSAAEQTGTRAH